MWYTGLVILSYPVACGGLLRTGIELVFPALQGRFLTTGLPGKPEAGLFKPSDFVLCMELRILTLPKMCVALFISY